MKVSISAERDDWRLSIDKTTRTKYISFARAMKIDYLVRVIEYLKSRVVMNTKLTLTIEKKIIEQAKAYAKSRGRSLSDIIETYLKLIVTDEDQKEIEISPTVKALRGSFRLPDDLDYKKNLTEVLSKKYLD